MQIDSFTIDVPHQDIHLLSDIVTRMGWKKRFVRKNELDKAIDEVERGEVQEFNSVKELLDSVS